MTGDEWSIVHAERAALAADLRRLSHDQWATPSLCSGWDVRAVLAHMTATATTTPLRFVASLAKAGFRIRGVNAAGILEAPDAAANDTLARFTETIPSRDHPPGPVESWLGEVIVHAEDIRRPLGLAHGYPPTALVAVADFYRRTNRPVGGKKTTTHLTLRATDTVWTNGTGPEVQGPILELILAMTGRSIGLSQLSGPGYTILAARIEGRGRVD